MVLATDYANPSSGAPFITGRHKAGPYTHLVSVFWPPSSVAPFSDSLARMCLVVGFHEPIDAHVRVLLGGRQAFVPQEFLDHP